MSTLKMDREVYAVVRKLEDELDETSAATSRPPRLLTVSFVYESIRRSNSSLARNKKKVLETSIEKVLDSRRAEAHADARVDMDDLIEAAEEAKKTESSSRDASLLNRQIAKGWGFSTKMPKPQSPSSSAPPERAVSTPADDAAAGKPEDANGTKSALERQSNGEPRPKKRRWAKSDADRAPSTNVSIRDVAGVDDALNRLLHEVWFPLCAGEACEKMGYRFDNGVLLHGPSGCGKTTLAHAVAGSVGASFIPVSATSLISGTSGESEKNIRDVFSEAILIAPCLIFFDELDAIAGNRDSANKGMESRIVSELMAGMDRIKQQTTMGRNVVVLAATNRPEALDPSIRRRFGAEIDMGMPSEPAREQILRSLTRDLSLAPDVQFPALAKLTPGFVGSDLQHVVKAAVSESFRGSLDALLAHAATLAPPPPAAETTTTTPAQQSWLLLEAHRRAPWSASHITHAQFLTAIARTQPASKREGFSTIPDTTWAHVGALGPVRRRLEMSIIGPIKNPDLFTKVGIAPAAGILLWGPPGCGKTLVAKAVANESKANFISIKGPELLNKYVGESERAVRQLFARAKGSAPCILFFDEMDALVPKRDDSLSDASARVVNTLLTELDGVGDRSGIYVIGATNRPDIIDEAIRRPGRLGTSIYVGLPSADDRVDILRTLYRNSIGKKAGGESTVDLEVVARDARCDGFSGADLGNLMQAAAQACLERAYLGLVAGQDEIMMEGVTMDPVIAMEDWEAALKSTKPSVKDAEMYNEIQ